MALKQTAFDFDFVPEEKKPEEKKAPIVKETIRQETELTTAEPIVLEDEVVFKKDDSVVTKTRNSNGNGDTKKNTRGRMRLTDMTVTVDQIDVPEDKVLFEKRYYSIGAVSEMFKVNQSLIRFWENEFSILKPKKNAKGDRFFRPEDVKNLKLIYHLLRERKYTIEGAREFLKKSKNADKKFEMIESLKELKGFLLELKSNL